MSPWTVASQAPLSMGFSRQRYWSGLPVPSPGDLPDPGIGPRDRTQVSHIVGRRFNLCTTRCTTKLCVCVCIYITCMHICYTYIYTHKMILKTPLMYVFTWCLWKVCSAGMSALTNVKKPDKWKTQDLIEIFHLKVQQYCHYIELFLSQTFRINISTRLKHHSKCVWSHCLLI